MTKTKWGKCIKRMTFSCFTLLGHIWLSKWLKVWLAGLLTCARFHIIPHGSIIGTVILLECRACTLSALLTIRCVSHTAVFFAKLWAKLVVGTCITSISNKEGNLMRYTENYWDCFPNWVAFNRNTHLIPIGHVLRWTYICRYIVTGCSLSVYQFISYSASCINEKEPHEHHLADIMCIYYCSHTVRPT